MKQHIESGYWRTARHGQRRGIALITVLWVLVLMALIAASFATTTRTEVNLARNLVEGAKAEALAEAGVYRSILGLLGEVEGEEDEEEPWRVDGSVYGWLFADGEIRVAIQDEGGKIDLNAAEDQLLRGLFRAIGLEDDRASALTDAILDFRDPDDLRRLNGAEDGDYAANDLGHDSKDAPFEMVGELLQVYGMNRELYDAVAPVLTVYSGQEVPNEGIAPPLVKEALFNSLDEETEETLEDFDPDEELGPEEFGPEGFGADDDPSVILTSEPQLLREGDSDQRSNLGIFTAHAEGRTASGAVYALETVLQLTGDGDQPFQFFTWHRARRELFADAAQDADGE